jgi:hypothetical protein
MAAYRAAIRAADAELRAAFEIRQRLDDAEPETPPAREQMLREIAARAEAARKLVDDQEQRFDALRDLERAAPEQLAALPAMIDTLRGRITVSTATMDRLTGAYAPSAVASVAGNVTEATKAVESAAAETQRGQGLLDAQRSEAVVALRRAQEAVARAGLLLDAVDRLAERLDDAAARVRPELEAAATDVATARAAVADPRTVPPAVPASPPGPGQPALPPSTASDAAASLAAAERLLAEAQAAAGAVPLDPLFALERATAANQAADGIITGFREAQAEAQRRLARATSAVAAARGHVDRAVDFITTRRHGVGRTARTRAAEAEAQLAEAERLAGTDPDAAVVAAQRAIQMADEAYGRAASEFGAWNTGGGPVAGPYAPPPTGGGDVVGAIVGGLIGGMLAGGGGPGWGGSPWGHPTQRPRGAGSSSGGWGGSRAGGRPSGGGGSRPSGGGGRSTGGGSSGGGRVRGGRW